MDAIHRASLNGLLDIIVMIHSLIDNPCPSMLFPLHLKGLGAYTHTVCAAYAGDLIYKNLRTKSSKLQQLSFAGLCGVKDCSESHAIIDHTQVNVVQRMKVIVVGFCLNESSLQAVPYLIYLKCVAEMQSITGQSDKPDLLQNWNPGRG